MPTLLEGIGRLFKVVFGLLAVLVAVILISASLLYYHFTKDLPKITGIQDYNPPVVSEVFADDGTKIGEFWEECRYLLPYDQIPKAVVNAFVASEDERFWDHKGVDFKSILRAFFENLRAGKVVQGGSTITQQVTRSLLLTRERSFDRKIKEAILATQIEQNLSKEQILYIYLNQIYLGNRSYGVLAAARNYFHKDLKDLNLGEISMIAGLPSAPTTFSPIHNAAMARERQSRVLQRMLENGYITKAEHDAVIAQPLTIFRAGTDKDFNNKYAPYFVETVRRQIEDHFGAEALYRGGLKIQSTASLFANQAADRAVKRGLLELERRKGFHGPVENLPKEKWGELAEAVHRQLTEFDEPIPIPSDPNIPRLQTPIEPYHIYKGVITAMDAKGTATVLVGRREGVIEPSGRSWIGRTPKVGDVYWVRPLKEVGEKDKTERRESGLAGSRSGGAGGAGGPPVMDDRFTIEVEPKLESSLFSLNPLTGEVKVVVGGFSFKRSEFNRATQALRQTGSAFKPIVYAAALDKGYSPKTTVIDAPVVYQVGRNRFWSPKNYSNKYNGPMSVRSALTHSINVVAVKIFHDIGIDYAVAFARKLGITSPIAKYLSTALGASDITLQELTRAYSVFPAGGVRPDLIYVLKIVDKNGQVLVENKPNALDAEHVFDFVTMGSNEGINRDLMKEGEKVIEKDKLKLSPEELRVLYGTAIPPGHVITPQTAFVMVSLMKSVVDSGTGFKAKALGRPAAGKTGTTNDETDAWFVGYLPDLIAGVWLGYDSRKKIGPGMTGGVVSAPIWLYYMQEVTKDTPLKNFAVPADIKLAEVESMSGGSALPDSEPKPEDELEVPTGTAPASRGVDFLYNDLNKL